MLAFHAKNCCIYETTADFESSHWALKSTVITFVMNVLCIALPEAPLKFKPNGSICHGFYADHTHSVRIYQNHLLGQLSLD